MENVQRAVMLLKPDAHAAGQWRGVATLRLAAMPGGVALSLQGPANMGEECMLTLFSRDGLPISENELRGAVLQARATGIHIEDITGAAVICGGRFLLKSSGLDWPEVIARYRFAHAQPTTPPQPKEEVESIPEAAVSEPETVLEESPVPPEAAPEDSSPDLDAAVPEEGGAPEPTQEPPVESPSTPQEPSCPSGIRQSPVDPFPGVFPGSEWIKISYPGPAGWWHYIFGRARVEGYDADVVGVPGDYSMAPPPWLDGFSAYVRCSSGDARGYWLMFQDPQTGQVLDISRFRHGG